MNDSQCVTHTVRLHTHIAVCVVLDEFSCFFVAYYMSYACDEIALLITTVDELDMDYICYSDCGDSENKSTFGQLYHKAHYDDQLIYAMMT